MKVYSKQLLAVIITIVSIYVVLWIGNDFLAFPDIYQDENHYLPTARLFEKEIIPSIKLLKSYDQLNTPLPFILGGWVLRFFGDDIQNLRLMNFIISFLLLLFFLCYDRRRREKKWWCLVPLLAMPSFYLCSIHYYTDMVAWMCVLLGVIGYMKERHFFACLAFIGAISSRQYMLAFPFAIGLFEVARIYASRDNFSRFVRVELWKTRTWLYYAFAVLSILPWIVLWGGLAPSAIMKSQYYGDAPIYNPGFVIYMCACVAFYFVIPETILGGKWAFFRLYPVNNLRTFALIVFAVVLAISFFPPRQTFNPYFTWPYLGYFDQLLELFNISGWVKDAIYALFSIITLMRFVKPGVLTLSGLWMCVNVLLLGKAQLSWDKYLFPTLMVLWFLEMHQSDKTIDFLRERDERCLLEK